MSLTNKISSLLLHPIDGISKILNYVRYKPRFRRYYLNDRIRPHTLITYRYVSLGPNVRIGRYGRIQAITRYNDTIFTPSIEIGEGTSIEQNVHLTCAKRVRIGKNTAIAANVTITDINHPYTDITMPIERQDIEVKEVEIGDDCKIYNGAVILPGVRIGRHCVVGANSIVRTNVPDYCVVAGAPARIIKRYHHESKRWEKENPENEK